MTIVNPNIEEKEKIMRPERFTEAILISGTDQAVQTRVACPEGSCPYVSQ